MGHRTATSEKLLDTINSYTYKINIMNDLVINITTILIFSDDFTNIQLYN